VDVSDHLSCFTTLARPGAFLCMGALSILGRFLDASGAADGFGIRGRARGRRLSAITGLLIGLWLLYRAEAVAALPDTASVITLAPNAEKPAAGSAGRARRGNRLMLLGRNAVAALSALVDGMPPARMTADDIIDFKSLHRGLSKERCIEILRECGHLRTGP
jgi:hypothetical protein